MNAKDAYQNTLWNKLPYDLKQSIFAATENGEFSVTVKVTGNDEKDVTNWISYLRSDDWKDAIKEFLSFIITSEENGVIIYRNQYINELNDVYETLKAKNSYGKSII